MKRLTFAAEYITSIFQKDRSNCFYNNCLTVTRYGVADITAANHWTSDIREYVPDYLECH